MRRRADPTKKKKTTHPRVLTQRRPNLSGGRNPPVAENARVDTIGGALARYRVWGDRAPPYRSHSTPAPARSPPARCTRAPIYDAIIFRTRLFTKCLLFCFLLFLPRALSPIPCPPVRSPSRPAARRPACPPTFTTCLFSQLFFNFLKSCLPRLAPPPAPPLPF